MTNSGCACTLHCYLLSMVREKAKSIIKENKKGKEHKLQTMTSELQYFAKRPSLTDITDVGVPRLWRHKNSSLAMGSFLRVWRAQTLQQMWLQSSSPGQKDAR